jgi:hypothetical protein
MNLIYNLQYDWVRSKSQVDKTAVTNRYFSKLDRQECRLVADGPNTKPNIKQDGAIIFSRGP